MKRLLFILFCFAWSAACAHAAETAPPAGIAPLTVAEQARVNEALDILRSRGELPPQLERALIDGPPVDAPPPGTVPEVKAGAPSLPTTRVIQLSPLPPPTPGQTVPIEFFDGYLRPRPVPGSKPLPENPTAEDVYRAMDNLQARLNGFSNRVTDFENYMVMMDAKMASIELLQQQALTTIASIQTEIDSWETKFIDLSNDLNAAIADANASKETIVNIQGQLNLASRKISGLRGQVAALEDLARPGGIIRALLRR